MAKRLTREELVRVVHDVLNPNGFTSEEVNQKLLLFAINCPDPAAALDLMIEKEDPITAERVVDEALSYPSRDVNSLPESELHPDHPLRHMKLDP
jgi:hypothetical protein